MDINEIQPITSENKDDAVDTLLTAADVYRGLLMLLIDRDSSALEFLQSKYPEALQAGEGSDLVLKQWADFLERRDIQIDL